MRRKPVVNSEPVRKSPRASPRVKVKFPAATSTEKRKSTPAALPVAPPIVEDIPVQKKTAQDGHEIDQYCWMCHQLGQDEVCSACPRVYHTRCIKRYNRFNAEGLCSECQTTSIDGTVLAPISCKKLTRLLKHALDRMLTNESALKSWPITPDNEKLLCIMDLSKLADKLNDEIFQYKKTAEFYSDVKWLYHNCCIVFGNNHDLTACAKRILKKIKDELRNLEACPECYEHANSNDELFFVRVCNVKHHLVWAKLKGYPYWPAKCLKVNNGVADVRFFKTHDMGNIKVNKCYLLSKEGPDGNSKNVDYQEAIKELNMYIQNWQLKFGPYTYAQHRTIFDPAKLDNINGDSSRKSTGKRSRRRRAVSGGANRKETVTEASDEPDASVDISNGDSDSIMDISNGPNASIGVEALNSATGSVLTDIEIINEIPRPSSTLVRKRNFMENLSLSNREIISERSNPSLFKRPRIDRSQNVGIEPTSIDLSGRSVETNGLNPVTVCMMFSTDDEEESASLDEEIDRNTEQRHIESINVEMPVSVESEHETHPFSVSDNHQILETSVPDVNSLLTVVPALSSEVDYVVAGTEEVISNGNIVTMNSVSIQNSIPIQTSSIDINSSINDCGIHSSELMADMEHSHNTTSSPIRIVGSGTVPNEQPAEIIDIVNSPEPARTADDDSTDVLCDSPVIRSSTHLNFPHNPHFQRFNHIHDAINEGPFSPNCNLSLTHNAELGNICQQISSSMQGVVSQVWNLSKKHFATSNADERFRNLLESAKKKEEALAVAFEEKQKQYEAKLQENNQTCENLKKKIHDTDLILLNTRQEFALAETEKLENARKEWETEKEKEINKLREIIANKMSKEEFESELARKMEAKDKEHQADLAKKMEVKEKEHQEDLAKKLQIKEKEFQKNLEVKLAEAKRKEWCANCLTEAKFRCCWNTSYCGQACQRAHWQDHMQMCETVNPGDTVTSEIQGAATNKENKNKLVSVSEISSSVQAASLAQPNTRNIPAFLFELRNPPANNINLNGIPVPQRLPTVAQNSHLIQDGTLVSPRLVRAPICYPAITCHPKSLTGNKG